VRTIRALRNEDFDLVHIHEPLVPGPSLTALLFSDRPIVGTFHRAGASTAYALLKPLVRRIGGRITHKVAVSEDARRTAYDGVGGEFTILFNGIDVDRFAKAKAWPSEGRTILFVGRHESRKGLAVLLDARRLLPDDVTIWVAGSGPETERLKASTVDDERIQWIGRVSDEELAERLAGADIFCAPSLHGESFGVVLIEAMAAGTAIVASDLPGYRAVARPDEHALLVPPEDPAALAGALIALLDDANRRDELVAAGRDRAGVFAMPLLAEAYADIYASLL
jgi:phosphatidylinositol alpha-mannosyltransferase